MRIYDFELDPEPVKLDGRVSWPAYTDGYSIWSPAEQHRSGTCPARQIMVHEVDGCLARDQSLHQHISTLRNELAVYKARVAFLESSYTSR